MKKNLVFYILICCLLTACSSTKTQPTRRITTLYTSDILIPPSPDTESHIAAYGSISSFDQIFPDRDKITGIGISSAKIESGGPSKRNLGMFKSIKMYLSTSNGSNDVLIASRSTIPRDAGNSLVLELNRNIKADHAIRSDKIDPNTSIEQSILGKLAGVQVVSPTSPGGAGQINIRGTSNLSGGPPLYVVDGIEGRGIQGLNPADVESIEVLKNAGDLAMYGVRGANGVVVVTTKRGNSLTGKKEGSLSNFVKGSNVWIRCEYVLRYPLTSETSLHVNVNFR